MSAVPSSSPGSNLNKTKARYLLALKNVLKWDQIRHCVALFDDLCGPGVNDVSPEQFAAVIAAEIPGANGLEQALIMALSGTDVVASNTVRIDSASSNSLDRPTEVFNAVLNSVLQQIAEQFERQIDNICSTLPGEFSSTTGLGSHRATFEHWFATFKVQNNATISVDLPITSLTELVDTLYTVCCNACGPQSTDRIFARAITEAERLPAARHFPPRQLL